MLRFKRGLDVDYVNDPARRRPLFAGSGEEWPPTRRIIYVVDVQATLESQHLILDTLLQDLKQNGEWGKPRKQRIPRWQITSLPDADDRQIFAMLAGSREQTDYGYYGYDYQDAYDTAPFRHRLTAPLPQIVLPLIARSGRCYLKARSDSDELNLVEWEEGEPWRFSIRVRRDDGRANQYVVEGVLRRGEELDRKSTRLNSSHVKISYAVFCLKKKKNTESGISREAESSQEE